MTLATSSKPHKQLACTRDFSRFRIGQRLRDELENFGDFSCEDILYGFPPTCTSGHLDGCRWLFGVQKHAKQSWFLIFAPDVTAEVRWDNLDDLAFQRSWDYMAALDRSVTNGFLSHEATLSAVLHAARRFRKKRPFA